MILPAYATPPSPAVADRAVPLPVAECQSLARVLSRASGLVLGARQGAANSVDQNGPAGEACVIKGEGRRKRSDFPSVLARVVAAPTGQGWRYDPISDADAPFEAFRAFRRGYERLVVQLERSPPPGLCENVALADCTAPPGRWSWTLNAAAYRSAARR